MGFPGSDQGADASDLNSEVSYGINAAHMKTVMANEALVLDGARRYPDLDIFGLNPGLIKSDIRSGVLGAGTLKHRFVEWMIGMIFVSAEQYAARIVPALWSRDLDDRSGVHLNRKRMAIERSPALTEAGVDAIMAASDVLVQKAAGDGS